MEIFLLVVLGVMAGSALSATLIPKISGEADKKAIDIVTLFNVSIFFVSAGIMIFVGLYTLFSEY